MKSLFLAAGCCVSAMAVAQYNFFSSSTFTGTTSVSNTGVAVGAMGSAWGLWDPANSSTPTSIGGTTSVGTAGISWDGMYVGACSKAADGKAEMSRYSVGSSAWTTMGGAGGYSSSTRSSCGGISGDGSTVFGYGYGTYTGTGSGTYTGIDPISNNGSGVVKYNIIPNANSINRINASNYDGTVLAGRMRYYSSGTVQADGAYYYSGGVAYGIMGTATDYYGEPRAISGDGRYVAGNFNYFTQVNNGAVATRRPYVYDSQTNSTIVLDSIAGLNGNAITSDANTIDGFVTGMSGDGNTVIGYYRETIPSYINETWGFIWQRGIGIQSFDAWAAANGVAAPGTTWLVPTAISGDGKNIAGYQYTRTGYTTSGFMIQPVPEPATFAVLAIGGIALLRRKRK